MSRSFLVAIVLSLAILFGCKNKESESEITQSATAPRRVELEMTVLVVDDAELAAAVKLLRGEWTELSGGSIKVQELSSAEMLTGERLDADLVIYPSSLLAELVSKSWLRPVRQSMLDADSFAFDDLLPLVRNRVMRYGGHVFGVSLGEAPLMLAKESTTQEQGNEDDLANEDWLGLNKWQPVSPEQRDYLAEFIARAAAYTDPRQRDELLFAPDSMAPRLMAPPMVRALSMMVAQKSANAGSARFQVFCPIKSSLDGKEALALSDLPPAEETYDLLRDKWEKSKPRSNLAILGFSGRMASVTSSTRNATSAFKLLGWLTSGTAAVQLSSRSLDTVWFRNSQSRKSQQWLKLANSGQIEPILTSLLSSDEYFLIPRVTSIDRYLEVLANAVREACQQGGEPGEVLESVSEQWETLTDELGRQKQKRSYRYHLGLDAWAK